MFPRQTRRFFGPRGLLAFSAVQSVDVIVVGAGVVGLAVARALALGGREVVVLERNDRIGEETSSRNSGVIHSGIYYPPGSLKASLCVRGRELLYGYCAERQIAHARVGKIVVAQSDQLAALRALYERGIRNGVTDLQWLTASEVQTLEPQVRCASALLSPSSGIIDVHQYLVGLWGDLERAAAVVVFRCEMQSARPTADGMEVTVRSGSETSTLGCRWMINSAGLHAVALLSQIESYPAGLLRRPYLAKGNYFTCRGGKPFSRLVYPMPNEAGLGVHATLDMDGSTRFGPDVEWIDEIDYDVDAARVEMFYAAVREYWPSIPPGSLQPAYAGIRPKLTGPDGKAADFVIEGPATHCVPGLVNLLGVESPGLTASLAIGEHVARLVSAGSTAARDVPVVSAMP